MSTAAPFIADRFAGRTVIVTGADSGIGRATAEELAATITWLLGDDAANVNGALVPCDGGWSAV